MNKKWALLKSERFQLNIKKISYQKEVSIRKFKREINVFPFHISLVTWLQESDYMLLYYV